jgi:Thioredoxin-like domain
LDGLLDRRGPQPTHTLRKRRTAAASAVHLTSCQAKASVRQKHNDQSASQVERRVNVTAPAGAVTWLNDLESATDMRYARWPRQLRELLQPMFPGQVRHSGIGFGK